MEICSTCHAGCCRKHNIDVTGYDIIKIMNDLSLNVSFFTEALPVDNQYAKAMMNKVALFKFLDGEADKYYRMSLKMRESALFSGTLKCMFLQEWTDEDESSENFGKIIARCGIYNSRPLTCSTYPTKLEQNGFSAYFVDPFKTSEPNLPPAYKECSRELTEQDFSFESHDIMNKLVAHKFEMEFFKKVSAKWNKNPKVSDELQEFLKQEYNDRLKFKSKNVF